MAMTMILTYDEDCRPSSVLVFAIPRPAKLFSRIPCSFTEFFKPREIFDEYGNIMFFMANFRKENLL